MNSQERFETRRIFQRKGTSQNLVRELLQMMFLGEMLAPGPDRACLVSPWISNVVIFDNRAGGFKAINPDWGSREIRLIEVIVDIMARGKSFGIATNHSDHNDSFINELTSLVSEFGLTKNLEITRRENLHIKGLLLQKGVLSGSMNFTYSGFEINEESVLFETSADSLARMQINFGTYWYDK